MNKSVLISQTSIEDDIDADADNQPNPELVSLALVSVQKWLDERAERNAFAASLGEEELSGERS